MSWKSLLNLCEQEWTINDVSQGQSLIDNEGPNFTKLGPHSNMPEEVLDVKNLLKKKSQYGTIQKIKVFLLNPISMKMIRLGDRVEGKCPGTPFPYYYFILLLFI